MQHIPLLCVAKTDIDKVDGKSVEQLNIFDMNFISENYIDKERFVIIYANFKVLYDEQKMKLHLNNELKDKLQRNYLKALSIVECNPFFFIDTNGYMSCDFISVFRYQGLQFIDEVLGLSINDFKIKRIDNVEYENEFMFVTIIIEQRGRNE